RRLELHHAQPAARPPGPCVRQRTVSASTAARGTLRTINANGPRGPARAGEQSRRAKPWAKFVQGTQHRLMGSSLGPTTVLEHQWVRAESAFWLGTWAATPNTGCLAPRWYSRSRRRPPSTFGRRVQRQGP